MTKNRSIQTRRRYLTALEDLHDILQFTDKVNMAEFVTKHKIGGSFATVAAQKGIISFTGYRTTRRYKWVSEVEPNPDMALALINAINEYARSLKAKRDELKREKEETMLSEQEIDGKKMGDAPEPKKEETTTEVVVEVEETVTEPPLRDTNTYLPILPAPKVEECRKEIRLFGIKVWSSVWRNVTKFESGTTV